MNARFFGCLAVSLVIGCGKPAPSGSSETPDPSPHRSHFVAVNGALLNVLEWGAASGVPPLILVHGMGGSPHDFDAIAPIVAKDRRVIAYARRGHARSQHKQPFDAVTLAEDLRQLMDSLHIDSAYLGGESMGSLEITMVAGANPSRVKGLVYIEGWDWSDTMFTGKQALFPHLDLSQKPADLASFPAYYRWYMKTWMPDVIPSPTTEAAVRDIVVLDAAGRVSVPTDTLGETLKKTGWGTRLDFRKVKAPALVMVAERMWPVQVPDSAVASVAVWNNAMAAFKRGQIVRMMREMGPIDTMTIRDVTHASIGVDASDGVGEAIRRFLARH